MNGLDSFGEIWCCDFEYRSTDGELPGVVCMVAREMRSGRRLRLWWDILQHFSQAPFATDESALFVAYYNVAELSCFLQLGWSVPTRMLDLYAEFRCMTSGLPVPAGRGLLGAMAYFGLDSMAAVEKSEMRDLILRGGGRTESEQTAILDYCESDVIALEKLLPAMAPKIDVPRALLRGRYTAAVARMERSGIPVDVATLALLRDGWESIKGALVREVDADYGCFIPTGQRTINPETAFGSTVLTEATQSGVDPHRLADAADYLWKRKRESERAYEGARSEARKRTGLTVGRIARWENGLARDVASYPGFDEIARDVADELPELGINSDQAARLWDALREPAGQATLRHDAAIMAAAVEIVEQSDAEHFGPLSFSMERWSQYLIRQDIPWPRLESGALDMSDDTFRQMARMYPEVSAMRELRFSLSQMRLSNLTVGKDGRNRCMLSPFGSKTGRNQPSNSKFLFGPSVWIRGLIQPEPDRAIAYIDWSQQEFGIGAALSGDANMMAAYRSADPYLAFAKQAGAVPENATKDTHPDERALFKICVLAVQYGMGEKSLALSLGKPQALARHLLLQHRLTYPMYWRWSERAVDHAFLKGYLHTVFGWRVHPGDRANSRSLQNFPMQANGAEMLRLACCMGTEAGIKICAPVHDAVLIEAAADEIEAETARMQSIMADASRIILDGFELQTDAEIVRWPDRYSDPRGEVMWDKVMGLLEPVEPAGDAPF